MKSLQNDTLQIPLFKVENHIDRWKIPSPKYISENTTTDYLQWKFDLLLQQDHLLNEILLGVQRLSGSAVVFGGWVRDNIFAHYIQSEPQPRDIDIVVDGLTFTQLRSLLPTNTEVNIFGGCSTSTTTTKLDIWLLKDTFLVARMGLPLCFEILPSTTVFRLNSIIFQPQQLWQISGLWDFGCTESITEQVLDFQSSLIPLPQIQVARAVIYSAKFQLRLEPRIITFIQNICKNEDVVAQIKQGLESYCSKHLLLKASQLLTNIIDE